MSWAMLKKFSCVGRRFINNVDGYSDFECGGVSDGNDTEEVTNVTIADALEPEDKEKDAKIQWSC